MKSTRFKKKLVLTKNTVANLNDGQLNQVKGGKPLTVSVCHTLFHGCTADCPTDGC